MDKPSDNRRGGVGRQNDEDGQGASTEAKVEQAHSKGTHSMRILVS